MARKLTRLAVAWMALAVLALPVRRAWAQGPSENTQAKCSDGKDNDRAGLVDGDDPDCAPFGGGGGGGGGGEPADVPIDVHWTGTFGAVPGIYEQDPRPCTLSSTTNDYGSYHCWHVGAPDVTYGLPGIGASGVAQTLRRGDPSFCDAFAPALTLNPNSAYEVSWEGDCTVACTVGILNWSYGTDGGMDQVGGADTMRLWAYAEVGGSSNPNPFADGPLTLSPDLVEVTFAGEGTNKKVAICAYTGSAIAGIQFEVTPVVP